MENQFEKLKLKIGPYEIIPLPTGIFGLDGGAMFGTVPKVLWSKNNPPDEKNRIPMEARALLLKSPDRNVVIDTGNGGDFVLKYGEKLGPKFSEMYNIIDSGPSLQKSLAAAGVGLDDVTDVILTHLHFDHAGGATIARNGKLTATFPKASYYVQNRNLETAKAPNLREKASYYPANFEPLLSENKLNLLNGDIEHLLPMISVYVSNGHTQGQQIVKVSDGVNSLLYCGDVVPTSSHVKTAWLMGYDLHPLLLMEEKIKFLTQAARENWYLFFEHDPYADCAQISANGSDFAVKNRYHLSNT
jgi:glyoxylase-like metal-dependent hydrolase (beta-lactamase superfamily II)